MATLPRIFTQQPAPAAPVLTTPGKLSAFPGDRDPYALRMLPQEDVFFHCKRIDNSRMVREQDPKAPRAAWSAIAAASAIIVLLGAAMAPGIANTFAGYRLESLRAEERRLREEFRSIELEQAKVLTPARLLQAAEQQNMTAPGPDQVVHLDGKPDGAVAMVK